MFGLSIPVTILIIFYLVMSVITFIVYAVDKSAAVHHRYRVPEKTLLLLAFFGGALGALLAMYTVRHKTRKWYFAVPVPVMLMVQVGVLVYGILLK